MNKIIELVALVVGMWLLGYLMGKIEEQNRGNDNE